MVLLYWLMLFGLSLVIASTLGMHNQDYRAKQPQLDWPKRDLPYNFLIMAARPETAFGSSGIEIFETSWSIFSDFAIKRQRMKIGLGIILQYLSLNFQSNMPNCSTDSEQLVEFLAAELAFGAYAA